VTKTYIIFYSIFFSPPEYRDVTKRPGQGQNIVKCDYGVPRPPGKVCDIDMNRFGPCKKENSYSYGKGTPCIFLKLNKV
jgi:Sodium / potassium ATPase beta chain.